MEKGKASAALEGKNDSGCRSTRQCKEKELRFYDFINLLWNAYESIEDPIYCLSRPGYE